MSQRRSRLKTAVNIPVKPPKSVTFDLKSESNVEPSPNTTQDTTPDISNALTQPIETEDFEKTPTLVLHSVDSSSPATPATPERPTPSVTPSQPSSTPSTPRPPTPRTPGPSLEEIEVLKRNRHVSERTRHPSHVQFYSKHPTGNIYQTRGGVSSLVGGSTSTETLRQRLLNASQLSIVSKYSAMKRDFLTRQKLTPLPEPSKMKMLDFAFWNPPKVKKPKKIKSEDAGEVEDATKKKTKKRKASLVKIEESETEDEEKEASVRETRSKKIGGPKVKVGPGGKLILDEKSLYIPTSQSTRSKSKLAKMETVSDDANTGCKYAYKSKRCKRGSEWGEKETLRFYQALSTCGSDFSLMTKYFPTRSRGELKTKYKREDRKNPNQVTAALQAQFFDSDAEEQLENMDDDDDDNDSDQT